MIGFDYTERIPPAALKAAGCSLVSRYVTRLDWPKSLQRPEAEELRAAGMPILCNFESTADRMKGGFVAGQADAAEALQHLAALGAPAGVTVWFSADWDVQPGEVPAVLAYLQAAAGVLGSKFRVGLYGGLRAVAAAADAGYGTWQTIAWSGGKWDPRAVMRQTGAEQTVAGVQVDVNEIIDLAALGAWGGPTAGGSTVPAIPPSIGQKWPEIAGEFTGQYDDSTAIIWSDAGARAAALYAREARDAVTALAAKLGAPLDVAALAAQLGPLLHPTTDVNALAAALAPHVGAPDPAAFAAALAPHIKVTSA